MARVFGLELIHMADADVLPYDYRVYGREVIRYLNSEKKHASDLSVSADFTKADTAARRFAAAGEAIYITQTGSPANLARLNQALRAAETALLNDAGLPKRPWFKHTIYAPGEYTGYAAVVIPGVTEGVDAKDNARTQSQLDALTSALNRSAAALEDAGK